jgi:hypothetical protein
VFCSGHASELTYCKNLWIMGPTRRAKVCIYLYIHRRLCCRPPKTLVRSPSTEPRSGRKANRD